MINFLKPTKPLGIVFQLVGAGLLLYQFPVPGQTLRDAINWPLLICSAVLIAWGGWPARRPR